MNDVPYVSQFANALYAEKVLAHGIDVGSDPNWQSTGATTQEEYADWALEICGMACFSMVLQFFGKQDPGIVPLAKEAKIHRVYEQHGDRLTGMQYKEFSQWAKSFSIKADVYPWLPVQGIQKLLSKGKLVMVSVNPNVRGYETAPKDQKGGHLILVVGYNQEKKTITFHNPSGFASQNAQANHELPISTFLNFYAGRGIALDEQ